MKMLKSKKALSPVVASIILIAVTVAVSIAVAAWMGALSVGFMATEQISITKCDFDPDEDTITLTLRNSGTTDVVISSATVNGESAGITGDTVTVPKNAEKTVELTIANVVEGNSYQIRLMSNKGNTFMYTAVAPD